MKPRTITIISSCLLALSVSVIVLSALCLSGRFGELSNVTFALHVGSVVVNLMSIYVNMKNLFRA